MAVKKLWRCNVCNDVHYGIKPPTVCPTCGAKSAYVLIDYEEMKKVILDDSERLSSEDIIIAAWKDFTKDRPYKLNPDDEFVRTLAKGEIENLKNHGLKYCPCRMTTGDYKADLDLICPCNFFIQQTYKEIGECWCGLFVKR